MKEQQKSNIEWYFLGIIALINIILMIIEPEKAAISLDYALKIVYKVIPALILVFLIMVIINIFLESRHVQKYLGRSSGVRGWFVAVIAGIVSSGPVYMWYPMLKELKMSGARTALISVFLYNRSVKLPLLPMLITYFGVEYTIVLTFIIVAISPLQGWLVEQIAD